jgi:PAS domain S-box-containing protein
MPHKSETIAPSIFLELLLSLSTEKEEAVILEKSLKLYLRKLNCFMVGIFTFENKKIRPLGLLPSNFQNKKEYGLLTAFLEQQKQQTHIINKTFSDSTFHICTLHDYGILVLGRKKGFSQQILNELEPVIQNLGQSLSLAKLIGLKEQSELNTKSLLENLNLLKSFIQNTKDALQVADTSGKIVFLNKEACDRLGIKPDEISNYNVWDFEPMFLNYSEWENHVDELKRNRKTTIESRNFNVKTKKEIPVEVTVTFTEIGDKSFIIAVSRDITERKIANDELLRREKMLLAISSSTNILLSGTDVYASISSSLSLIGEAVNVDRTYLFTNQEDPEHGLLTSQRAEWNSGIAEPQIDNPELQNFPISVFHDFLAVLEQGMPFVTLIRDMSPTSELRAVLESQSIVSIVIIPVYHNSKFWGFVGFDDCQNERSWSEAEISILQTYVSAIQNALDREDKIETIKSMALFPLQNPDPVIRINIHGDIILQNNAALNINEMHLNGTQISKFALFDFITSQIPSKRKTIQFEIEVANSAYYAVLCKYIDDLEQINLYFSNITIQKRTEIELREAKIKAEESDKAKEEFIANVSHEIRTPLHAIIGLSNQLLNTLQSKQNLEFVQHIAQSGKHLQSLMDNILDFSKIAAGEFELTLTKFNLHKLVTQIESIVRPLATEKGLALSFSVHPSIRQELIGDETRIRQIMINFLSNAIKFTEQGSVDVSIYPAEESTTVQKLYIVIADTGIGMSETFVQKIFDKFSQEDATIQRKFGGTGLGMAISKELINLMNGEIHVKSAKGIGTQFAISIPFGIPDRPIAEPSSLESNLNSLANQLIMLVEDNAINRLVVKTQLKQHGIHLIEVENGLQAIQHPKLSEVNLILMDLQMPEMDGFSATLHIRNQLKLHMPIIALTANAIKTEIDRCFEVGMNDYVLKPFNESLLMQKIQQHLASNSYESHKKIPETSEILPLVDLGKLKELSMNSPEFLSSIIELFLQQIPHELEQIKGFWNEKEYDMVKKIIHRIKPNFIQFGILQLTDEINQLHNFNPNEPLELHEAQVSLHKILETMPHVFAILKTKLSQSKGNL